MPLSVYKSEVTSTGGQISAGDVQEIGDRLRYWSFPTKETVLIRDQYIIAFHGENVTSTVKERWDAKYKESQAIQKIVNSIKKVHNRYVFDNERQIQSYLLKNPFLLNILDDASLHIHNIFGSVNTCLELFHDPEENWERLFIKIQSPHPTDENIKLIDRFHFEWFFEAQADADWRLSAIVEPNKI
jgi:hypothetical protein